MIGGLVNAILGQNDARVKAYKADTSAGTKAIQQQAEQAKAAGYSLAASGRGGMGAASNIRGAQLAGAQVQQGALQQRRQLEQQAATDYAKQQQTASQANAQIEGQNSAGLQKIAGLAAGAAMMLSDERSKRPLRYDSAFNANDGRRVIPVQQDPLAAREAAIMQQHAAEQGVALSAQDQAQLRGVSARPQSPVARQAAQGAVPAAPGPVDATAGPSYWDRVGASLMQLSDERAKKLEDENSSLRSALASLGIAPRTEARQMQEAAPVQRGSYYQPEFRNEAEMRAFEAARYQESLGAIEQQRRQEEQAAVAAAKQDQLDRGMRGLADYERDRLMQQADFRAPAATATSRGVVQPYYAQPPPPQIPSDYRTKRVSDEEAKGLMGMGQMDFPRGVKPVAFEYREEAMGLPGAEPGQKFGVLAQDLEKSREGRTVVEEDPASGMKMVDTPELTMLLTAKISEQEERLRRLEKRRRG